jgi:hypothetical protein
VSPGERGGFHIFLSYGREPNAIHAGRLHDSLIAGVDEHPGFSEDQIFMDIDTIAPGDDFREAIADAVAKCDVFVALIGKQWATIRDKQRERRLDNPGDYVRLELEAALERKIPVVPVLVDGAKMPSERDLPKSLSPLVYRQAVELTNARWRDDVGRLLASLKTREQASRPEELRASKPSLKQLFPTQQQPSPHQTMPPWEAFVMSHKIGDVVDGTVTRVVDKTAVIELAPGVLAVLSGKPVLNLLKPLQLEIAGRRLVSEGETVRVKIEEVDRQVPIFQIKLSLA